MQSLTRVLWARGKLWLFCVESVYFGTAQTRTFWAKGIVCLFCLRLVGLATSMQSALSKGNSVSFLCRIVWFHYFASFVSHWWIWVRVRRKPSVVKQIFWGRIRQEPSGQREFRAFSVSDWLVWARVCRVLWAKGILRAFCVAQVGFNTVPFLCRLGWFVYGSDENLRDRGCDFFVSN